MNKLEHITLATRKDFTIQWFSGTGAGGQHRNKHQNCCRLTHKPTGMSETGQEHRDRPSNLRAAFRRLAARIVDDYRHTLALDRLSEVVGDRHTTVRTYHAVRNEVRDHASGLRMEYSEVIEKNNLTPMIEARRAHFLTKQIEGGNHEK